MEEHNKRTLIEALSSLPEHEPKELLWDKIEGEMDGGFEGIVTPQLLQAMPQHEPPASAWEAILRKLAGENRSAKIVRLSWRKVVAVAASLAVLLLVYWQTQRTQQVEMNLVAVNFSEETIDPMLLERDWDEDEAAFREFLSLCEAKKMLCEQPEFKHLQGELEELTAAKEELSMVLGKYGTDAALVTQIKEIELERNGLLKKMMAMLI